MTFDHYLPRHFPFLLILLLYLALSLTYAWQVPLGEAPDESAHLSYAQFIARNARLPAILAECGEAGYHSAWPPLYHFLVAGPLAAIGDTPPLALKPSVILPAASSQPTAKPLPPSSIPPTEHFPEAACLWPGSWASSFPSL